MKSSVQSSMQTHFSQDLGNVRMIADSLMMYSTLRLRMRHLRIALLGWRVAMPYLELSSDRPMFSTKLVFLE
jgi:hypothetical protein